VSVRTDLEALRGEVADLVVDSATWIDSVIQKRLIVHLKDGTTIQGSLSTVMKDGVILRAAAYLNPGSSATPMAGEVFIPRENVAFIQLDE
jgi:small nuclear ribonucleoprotein (snRNP)-like protein